MLTAQEIVIGNQLHIFGMSAYIVGLATLFIYLTVAHLESRSLAPEVIGPLFIIIAVSFGVSTNNPSSSSYLEAREALSKTVECIK